MKVSMFILFLGYEHSDGLKTCVTYKKQLCRAQQT